MILFNWIKKNISFFLIISGIIITTVSFIKFVEWKFAQNKLVGQKNNTAVLPQQSNNTGTAGSTIYDNPTDRYSSVSANTSTKTELKKEPFKRQDYKDGMMIISIPKIGIKAGVMNGTFEAQLRYGPGLYDISPLPDYEGGNVCIAAHRDLYGAWFHNINELNKGDEIILEFNNVKYIYDVEKVSIVAKNDWSVTKPAGYNSVTLTSCYPSWTSRQRIVARGRLKEMKK